MARDPFVPKIYPAWDRTIPLDIYKMRRDAEYQRQRAEWLKDSPMAHAKDAEGRPLYSFNDKGRWRRTKPITKSRRREVLQRDGSACVLCDSRELLEIDHIVRYVDGGSNELSNLRTLCAQCHRKRGGQA